MIRPTEDFSFIRPTTGERIPVGQRLLPNPAEKLFAAPPRVGVVIGTFGAIPYIELALAVRRRLYNSLPILIHDDASDHTGKLAALCRDYGATFETNSSRMGFEMGALSSVVGGLRWAKEQNLDLLVRMSRRFIPLADWVPMLQQLALRSQYGTYGRDCQSYNYPLRPECLALAVEHWSQPQVLGEMTDFMLKNRASFMEEGYLYAYAAKVYEMNCAAAREVESKHFRMMPHQPFVQWNYVGPGRRIKAPGQLWHETASAEDYATAAREFGLSHGADAFAGYWSQAGV